MALFPWREINYCNRCACDTNYWDFHPATKTFGNPWLFWIKRGQTCTFQTCTLFSARILALTASRLPSMPSFPPPLLFIASTRFFSCNWSLFACSGKVRLIRALRGCKQRNLTVSKKAPTVSKKAFPVFYGFWRCVCKNRCFSCGIPREQALLRKSKTQKIARKADFSEPCLLQCT